MGALERLFGDRKELGLVAGLVLILVVLFAPIPSLLLDLAIVANFALALTILLLTLYVAKPVEFSTFPSLLLVSTLFRLSLNVAATRLILTDANAGDVINAIGAFAVGGNFVVGLVVFFILIVVQYVVVTSGAQRVSEVAARFMLDSMPGQQMSIDADLNMGLIDQKEAIRRRAALEKEASFYGAMDGASKFVKGDAVAGIIILLINIVAGWIIGVTQMGMDWAGALEHFTLLTIGDGIATQLPALIIAIATGIIVTRSSADRELSTEVFRQLSSMPRIIVIVAAILALLLALPGMPKWPILILIGGAFFAWRRMSVGKAHDAQPESAAPAEEDRGQRALVVALGQHLGETWKPLEALLMERIANLRDLQKRNLGFSFPALSFIDGAELGAHEYEIRLFGARYGGGRIEPDQVLAIRGKQVRARLVGAETPDPAFGLPSLWIDKDTAEGARQRGYSIVDPMSVFVTHLGEILSREAPSFITRAQTLSLLEAVRHRQNGLAEELVPTLLSLPDLQKILQNLVAENVSIEQIDLICEHLVDLARTEKDPAALTEALRQRLGHFICNRLMGARRHELAVLSLDPRLENQIQASLSASARRDALMLEPKVAENLLRQLSQSCADMVRNGREPVLLCGGEVRRPLRALARRVIPKLAILSVQEIPNSIDLTSFAIVRLEPTKPAQPQTTPNLHATPTPLSTSLPSNAQSQARPSMGEADLNWSGQHA